eukprot:2113734-Prymnesium_polylepis.1
MHARFLARSLTPDNPTSHTVIARVPHSSHAADLHAVWHARNDTSENQALRPRLSRVMAVQQQ